MISETQMRYGSRVSRHAIGRAAVRNHRRSAAEIHACGTLLAGVHDSLGSSRGVHDACVKLDCDPGARGRYRAVGNPASFHFVIPPGSRITFRNPNSRITLAAPFVRFPVRQ